MRLKFALFAALFAAAVVSLSACAGSGWRSLDTGPKIPDAQWIGHGVLAFWSPDAMARYGEHGDDILAAVLGDGLPVDLTELFAGNIGWQLLGGAVVLRPLALDVSPVEEDDTVRLGVTFQPVQLALMDDTGCTMTVEMSSVVVEVGLAASRDVVGNLSMHAAAPEAGKLSQPSVLAGPGCGDQPAVAEALSSAVFGAVVSRLTDPVGFVVQMELLGERLLGAGLPGRLDIERPGGEGAGRISVALAPNSEDGIEPAMLVSEGAVVVPLRVGLDSAQDACALGLAGEGGPTGVVAPPTPGLEGWDVAVAVRRDVLLEGLRHAVRGGGACAWGSRATDGPLVLADVLDVLPAEVRERLNWVGPQGVPATVRVRPTQEPVMELAGEGGPPSMVLSAEGISIEIYARLWDVDWLLAKVQLHIALLGSPTPVLRRVDGTHILMLRGTPKVLGAGQEGQEVLAALILEVLLGAQPSANDGVVEVPLLALPDVYIYPLIDTQFELQANHLMMRSKFQTETAPRLDHAVQQAALATPADSNAGCQKHPRGKNTAFGLVLMLLVGLWIGGQRHGTRQDPPRGL